MESVAVVAVPAAAAAEVCNGTMVSPAAAPSTVQVGAITTATTEEEHATTTTTTTTVLPTVFSVSLPDPGPIGMAVRSDPTSGNAVVRSVTPGSQAARAGVQAGDEICYAGTAGEVGLAFSTLLALCKSSCRPIVFDVKRMPGAAAAVAAASGSQEERPGVKDPPRVSTCASSAAPSSSAATSTTVGAHGHATALAAPAAGATPAKETVVVDLTDDSPPKKADDEMKARAAAARAYALGLTGSANGNATAATTRTIHPAAKPAATVATSLSWANAAGALAGNAISAGASMGKENTPSVPNRKVPSAMSEGALKRPYSAAISAVPVASAPAITSTATTKPASEPAKKKKKKKKKKKEAEVVFEALPDPGHVCKDFQFYSTLENETVSQIAEKLGVSSWRDIVNLPDNARYGKLFASTKFKSGTILRVPKSHSKWKIKSLRDEKRIADEEMTQCARCSGLERAIDAASNPMLMCDGCDLTCHLKCADGNLTSVPADDWFCRGCIDILRARKEGHYPELLATAAKRKGKSSTVRNLVGYSGPNLRATLPPLPTLSPNDSLDVDGSLRRRLIQALRSRREIVSRSMAETHNAVRSALIDRIPRLESAIELAQRDLRRKIMTETECRKAALRRHGLVDFGGENATEYSRSTWIKCRVRSGSTVTFSEYREVELRRRGGYYGTIYGVKPSANWTILAERRSRVLADPDYRDAKDEARRSRDDFERCQEELKETRRDLDQSAGLQHDERRRFEAEYDALLEGSDRNGEDDDDEVVVLETDDGAGRRARADGQEFVPKLMGRITLVDESNVHAMNMLLEPDELVLFLPYGGQASAVEGVAAAPALNDLAVGRSYAVFARAALFDRKRDDDQTIERGGVRDAQRTLMQLLRENDCHRHALVASTKLPSSVRVRGEDGATTTMATASAGGGGGSASLYNLCELVRDCNSDLDLPKEPTPHRMKENGLELRGYQQSSLRWMMDKESNLTGMGNAGEFWERLRFMGDNVNEDYFFCALTGTFCMDIFDYRADTGQKDAALDYGGFSTGGILGEEMGLGKTIICLALIVRNPPPKKNQMLKREHLWSLEGHNVNHPEYVAPPSVLGAVSSGSKRISLCNGTLVIVPMTLISQWQGEIERYAPFLSVMTLHNSENPSMELIATTDVVIMSTSLLLTASGGAQKKGKGRNLNTSKQLLSIVKRIHWHRIIIDEAHYNNVGQKTKLVLASLSSTHRHCVTGTPLGNSLDDLQGQLRFLRLPQLQRMEFWQNNVGDPYYEHSSEALRILRSVLSRMVVRHSKEQMENGQSIVSLPPRTIETELIPFGSVAEQQLYNAIEKRNRCNFEQLRQESRAAVLERSHALTFQLLSARQACCHTSMVDVEKLDQMNRETDPAYKAMLDAAKKDAESGEKNKDRASILAIAEHRAKPSAKTRVRSLVLKMQHGNELVECPVCLEPVGELDVAITSCGHLFCRECILNVLDAGTSRREPAGDCPSCRLTVSRKELTFLGEATDAGDQGAKAQTEKVGGGGTSGTVVTDANGFQITATEVNVAVSGSSVVRVGFEGAKKESAKAIKQRLMADAAKLPTIDPEFLGNYDACEERIGTKVARLLQEIDVMQKSDPTSKAVVFSQFADLLDICGQELAVRGIRFVRVYGTDKCHERADALLDFSSDPGIKIFLLSMRAGAVGLNLTAANHCFILDPPQNTALEEQAIDRVHRIGQSRPVCVKRLIVKGTVEERIVHFRRDLTNDRPASGTHVCDASLMTSEGAPKSAKRARTENVDFEGEAQGQEFQQERLQNLATLFGTTMVPSVFKA